MCHFDTTSESEDHIPVENSRFRRTCVYYPNWTVYSTKQSPLTIPSLNHITNLFYCFFKIGPDGAVSPSDEYCDLEQERDLVRLSARGHVQGLFAECFELKKRHRQIQFSMSIGGWSFREDFRNGVMSEGGIEKFVTTAVDLMMEYGFDGVDLDWEYPESPEEIHCYLKLIRALRIELNRREGLCELQPGSFLLTMAMPATMDKLPHWPISEMNQYLSFWNLMTYDFAGCWSEQSSYHCNLYPVKGSESSVQTTVNYFLSQGVDSKKLVIGMAGYGRSFVNTKGYGYCFKGVGKGPGDDDAEGTWNYKYLPIEGCKEEFDEQAVIAWCYSQRDKTFVSYDNIKSCEEKGKYVQRVNLGGGMWWDSTGLVKDHEEESLVDAFVRGTTDLLRCQNNLIHCYNDSKYLRDNGFDNK